MMDLVSDFRDLIISSLKELKASSKELSPNYKADDDVFDLTLKYFQLCDKLFIPQKKFNVLFSKELSSKLSCIPDSSHKAILDIKNRLDAGTDIVGYLSRSVRSADSPAMMVRNWNLHHAHIKEPIIEGQRKAKSSDILLFFTYDDATVYFLDVLPHPSGDNWFSTALLEIIYDNGWKHLLNIQPRLSNPKPKLTDAMINQRMKNTVVFIEVRGCVVMPFDGGVASSGDNNMAVKRAGYFVSNLKKWKTWHEQVIADYQWTEELIRNYEHFSKEVKEFEDIRLTHFDWDYFYIFDNQTKKETMLRIEDAVQDIDVKRNGQNLAVLYYKPLYFYVRDEKIGEIIKVRIDIHLD